MGSKKTLEPLVSFIARRRTLILVTILALTAIFFIGATRMTNEVILAHLFPYDHPYLKLHAKFSEVFGSGGSGVAIAVHSQKGDVFNPKTLTKIKKITEEIELWDEVYRVLTVSMASNSVKVVKTLAKGEIRIESLMFPDVPKNEEEMEELKKNIFSNPSYSGMLVSKDGTAAIILTEMKENIPYERMFKQLRGLVNTYSDPETSVHIVGFPMLMGWIYSFKTQMYIVFAISVILIILTLYPDLSKHSGHDRSPGQRPDADHLGIGIYWIHRDQLQPPALCPCLPCGSPNDRQFPPDYLPLL